MKSFFLSLVVAILSLLFSCNPDGRGNISSPIAELTPERIYFLTSLKNVEKYSYLANLCNAYSSGDSTKEFSPLKAPYRIIFNEDRGFTLILGDEIDYHRIISRLGNKREGKKDCQNYYSINDECYLCDKGGSDSKGGYTLVIFREKAKSVVIPTSTVPTPIKTDPMVSPGNRTKTGVPIPGNGRAKPPIPSPEQLEKSRMKSKTKGIDPLG